MLAGQPADLSRSGCLPRDVGQGRRAGFNPPMDLGGGGVKPHPTVATGLNSVGVINAEANSTRALDPEILTILLASNPESVAKFWVREICEALS